MQYSMLWTARETGSLFAIFLASTTIDHLHLSTPARALETCCGDSTGVQTEIRSADDVDDEESMEEMDARVSVR